MPRLCITTLLATVALLAACGGASDAPTTVPPPVVPPIVDPPPLGSTYTTSGRAAAGDVFVHMFEWRWPDLARECEQVLGPAGYKGVQISPPSEHAIIRSASDFYPWWQRYQTVSYRLDKSRSGTATEFGDMIARCRAVGVEVYADVVINHMTAGSGTGSAGSVYTKYNYPDAPFVSADFNPACSINTYMVATQVQLCELVGLSDLRTSAENVRARLAKYLIDLHQLGVAGFRVDAAKHVPPADLESIMTRVNAAATAAGRPKPYVFLEVIGSAGEAVTPQQYFGVGFASGGATDITDFTYGARISDAFLTRNGRTLAAALQSFQGELLPSDKSVVFIDNHDTQRGSALYYADSTYELAAIMMLAHGHGYPSLMSGYGFDRTGLSGRDSGPASDGSGNTIPIYNTDGTSKCTTVIGSAQVTSWICEHRREAIRQMVAFRRAAAGTPTTDCGRGDWRIDADPQRVALCRDGAGFLAMSLSATAATTVLVTRLPAGRYCNVAVHRLTKAAGASPATCSGTAITVASDGTASIAFSRRSAVALHIAARVN